MWHHATTLTIPIVNYIVCVNHLVKYISAMYYMNYPYDKSFSFDKELYCSVAHQDIHLREALFTFDILGRSDVEDLCDKVFMIF